MKQPLWRQRQMKSFRNLDALCDFLLLTEEQRQKLAHARPFPLLVPRRLAEKMAKGDLDDPLLRQFVPLAEEENSVPGFSLDPVEDRHFQVETRLLRKYKQRALLLTTGACAMHCRFCFRQNFDYATSQKPFSSELQAIAADDSLREIIFSGGDPLSLSNQVLQQLIGELEVIPHIKRLRFHTRFPVGIPERLDTAFCELLQNTRLQVYFVLHVNHPRELDDTVIAALNHLKVPLLAQIVLLKGVNDNVETLKVLCEELADHGIIPYYLHQLDRVAGAAHYEVAEEKGRELITALAEKLSGYAVPRYVRETPGAAGKMPV